MQASLGTAVMLRKVAAERARNGGLDRFAFRIDGDLTTSRAEMAGIHAALQKIEGDDECYGGYAP